MKLPIDIQTYIYVDKTKEVMEFVEDHKYIFFSSLRRFGKSLFLDVLRNIFESKKEYLKGLYIEDQYDFSVEYPAIKIVFYRNPFEKDSMQQVLNKIVRFDQEYLDIECDQPILDIIVNKQMRGCVTNQIKANKYHEKYLHVNKKMYLGGVSFHKKKRNIGKFEWEKAL